MTRKIVNRTLEDNQKKENYIFISDIHGNLETIDLIEQAKKDYPLAQLVTGGDYIDGREHVKEVLDYLMDQKNQGAIVLLGNHEQMMLNFADGIEHQNGIWFYNGGGKTLTNIFGRTFLPEKVRESKYYCFLKSCPTMYDTPQIILVHAGVRPDEKYNDPATYNKEVYGLKFDYDFYRIWAREEYWYSNQVDEIIAHNRTGKTIVTGHTPTAALEGKYNDGRKMKQLLRDDCIVRKMQYPGEPARIFTDGGSHSDPLIYPHNDGNVVVLDGDGKIVRIYNWKNPQGIEFNER
ncbi:metallophosphoesterase family protein [Lactobacillus helveticus]|uniref:metallophosphoesterase family protein n=1 Tax=Lactobacillus helveticus TaxID=1587 RepID=UPI001C651F21|nr:metallophosphoesterase family protein [Lactobacillus helveticus]MBW8009191.1 serine/threonine protein phosphatase [Lactobacillus helveticus]MBW8019232.1 serine/threonine protein phosphatase [Lactobacillus helveticus]MBW8043946.1 serine/threonine protein phosphatase [Lactobacillus helveticus]MBW8053351.1 serine/threonine protein phosphatase [Lactobacillus helveticus]